jgi:hypothetical protein
MENQCREMVLVFFRVNRDAARTRQFACTLLAWGRLKVTETFGRLYKRQARSSTRHSSFPITTRLNSTRSKADIVMLSSYTMSIDMLISVLCSVPPITPRYAAIREQ